MRIAERRCIAHWHEQSGLAVRDSLRNSSGGSCRQPGFPKDIASMTTPPMPSSFELSATTSATDISESASVR